MLQFINGLLRPFHLTVVKDTPPPPDCFGRFHDAEDPVCAGGLDPPYRDERGSQVRQRCDFFNACGERTKERRR